MNLSKNLILLLLCCFVSFNATAQDQIEAHGNLLYYTKDKILHIKVYSGNIPEKGQQVTVDKSFQLGQMKGTHSLANGEVIGGSNKDLQIKVSKYTSTKVVDGETVPMCQKDDEMIIKWSASEKEIATANFDADLLKAKTVFLKSEYKEAIPMLEKLIQQDEHCIDCHYVLGRCYVSLDNDTKAIPYLTKAIDLADNIERVISVYAYRKEAYKRTKQYEKSIADCDKLLTLDLKTSDVVYLLRFKLLLYSLEERSEEFDHNVARTHECECVNKIIALEGKTEENKGLYNRNCLENHPKDDIDTHTEFEVISQSEDSYTVKMRVIEASKLSCEDNLKHEPKPSKGIYGNLFICSTAKRSSLFRITAVEGDIVTLEILYWGYNMEDVYTIGSYKKGDIFIAEW